MITKYSAYFYKGVQLSIEYTYKPLVKGVYDRAPEDCYEDEPAEVDIQHISAPGDQNITELLSENIVNKIIDEIEKSELKQR